MRSSTEYIGARALVVRAAFLLFFVIGLAGLYAATDDRGLRAILPLYLGYIFIQLVPVVWPREVDLCSPVGLPLILGAYVSVGTLASFYDAGEPKLDLIPMLTPGRTEELVTASLYASLLGQVSYYAGYYSRFGRALRRIFPDLAGRIWDARRLFVVAVVAGLIFVASYVVFQLLVGVPLFDFTQLGEGKRAWRDDPTLSWMLRGIFLGMLPAYLYFTRSFGKHRIHTVIAGLAAIFVALLVSRIGIRGPSAYALLVLVIITHYLWRRIPVIVFAAVYFLGLTLSNIAYQWRAAPSGAPREMAVAQMMSNPTHVLVAHEEERQRFSSLAVVMDSFPDKVPYLLGESWASLAVVFVPRWLWPDKAKYYEWQDNRIIHTITGAPVPTPYIGVLFANFSWLGIFVGTFLFGAFQRGLYEWLRQNPRDPSVIVFYAVALFSAQPTILALSDVLSYLLPLYVILRYIGRKPALA